MKKSGKKNPRWIVGIDEAGRGPLAGPLAVGMVAVSSDFDMSVFETVKDSKQLREEERKAWFQIIQKLARHGEKTRLASLKYQVSLISNIVIDEKGIAEATRQGIKNVLSGINPKNSYVLLDGGITAPKEYKQKTIIKGDELIPVISLASIAAKVIRDRHMIGHAKRFPEYHFDAHKGYGTREHRERIEEYGLSPLHRRTFIHHT